MSRHIVSVLLIALALWSCSSTPKEDSLLTEVSNMDKESIFQKGEDLFNAGKVKDSRKYFSFVADTFPNDPLGHKAALRVADTYAQSKDSASLTEARLRYRDFANRYPNDPDRDYALLMMGKTYSIRHLRPDRDLSTLHEALDAYDQLISLYPNSKYFEEAKARILELKNILAMHEFQVAEFYAHNKRWIATIWRLEYLKDHYPDFGRMDEVDALLDRAREGLTLAREEFEQIMAKRRAKRKKKGKDEGMTEKPAPEDSPDSGKTAETDPQTGGDTQTPDETDGTE